MSAPKEKQREADVSGSGISGSGVQASPGATAVAPEPIPLNSPNGAPGRADQPGPASAASDAAASAPKRTMFEGDADLIELRRRLSIDSYDVPRPPLHRRRSVLGSSPVGRLLLSVAAISLFALAGIAIMRAPASSLFLLSPPVAIDPAMTTAEPANVRPTTSILIGIHDRQALVNEPIPLGAVLLGAGQEAIHITGLTEGSRLSAGEKWSSTDWRIPAEDVTATLLFPPLSFVGEMHAVIQLRSASDIAVDTQFARYEWVAKMAGRPAAERPRLTREDVAHLIPPADRLDTRRASGLVRRGMEFMKIGDFAAARLVLRPAAEAGDPQAALLLGATFDPVIVADLGAVGLAPDPDVARTWYRRAMASGSVEASRRIERLARTAP